MRRERRRHTRAEVRRTLGAIPERDGILTDGFYAEGVLRVSYFDPEHPDRAVRVVYGPCQVVTVERFEAGRGRRIGTDTYLVSPTRGMNLITLVRESIDWMQRRG